MTTKYDDGLVLQHLQSYSGNRVRDTRIIGIDYGRGSSRRVQVNKATHRVRFENETESQVTIVIEDKNVTE